MTKEAWGYVKAWYSDMNNPACASQSYLLFGMGLLAGVLFIWLMPVVGIFIVGMLGVLSVIVSFWLYGTDSEQLITSENL